MTLPLPPEIREIPSKRVIGQFIRLSLSSNRTFELWTKFMPAMKSNPALRNNQLISMRLYDEPLKLKEFTPSTLFTKWACVEAINNESIPDGMFEYVIPEGKYAVFLYKGLPSAADDFFNYIFMDWLPVSGYSLDARPHFDVLGEKYNHQSEDSEEEIWIPVR